MKKTAATILAVIIVLTNSAAAFADETEHYLTRGQAVIQIVDYLYKKNCPDFNIDDYYCIHDRGYTHFVPDDMQLANGYPLLCEIYNNVSSPGFTDVSWEYDNLTNHITLAKAMGIISGYPDNTFQSEKSITLNEAVKMLLCMSGLGAMGEIMGGYPSGYIKAAQQSGIIEKSGFDGGDYVSKKDFEKMLNNIDDSMQYPILQLTEVFTKPTTPEQCVSMYAQAVKDRNGGLQYALLSDELSSLKREDFEGFNWVTGVSSPWVSGYDIRNISDLIYEIEFYYETSTGPSGDLIINIELEEMYGGYRITNLINK